MLGTLAECAQRVAGEIVGDASFVVSSISSIDDAHSQTMTFATDAKYLAAAMASDAGAILVERSALGGDITTTKPLLVVESARSALATLLALARPPRLRGPYRDVHASIDATASVADDVYVGPHASIGPGATIAAGVTIEAGAYVGPRVTIGNDSWLQPRSTVMEDCVLGARVVLAPGSVIGSEGFGWSIVDGRLERIPQVGNVRLDDDVEIGANTCVDRAQTGSTVIGEGTKVDNLVQIGHNCRLGRHNAFAAQTGMAGSTIIGDYVQVGGQASFKGHITVGSRVTIAGASQIWGDIPDGAFVSGAPARDHRERLRFEVALRKIPKLFDRVTALERAKDARTNE